MDIRRFILFAALGFLSLNIINAWQHDVTSLQIKHEHANDHAMNIKPPIEPQGFVKTNQVNIETHQPENLIQIHTDVLDLNINLSTGNIVDASLVAYPVSLENKTPYQLLINDAPHVYEANSDLLTMEQDEVHSLNLPFKTEKTHYEMNPTDDQLVVNLHAFNSQGLLIEKKLTFSRGSYVIGVDYVLTNNGETPWVGYLNTQLRRESPEEDKSNLFHVGSYTGASYSNPEGHRYKKISFSDMHKQSLDVDVHGGWIAMQQRYFLSAWIPEQNSQNKFYTRALGEQNYTIGTVSQSITVNVHETKLVKSRLYVGPEVAHILKTVAPSLDLTIDYGWLWLISSFLFSLMTWINQWVGNWGWSIVLVTVLVKLAFYRLSATSYRSMAAMRQLQPKMQALRERYGDDKAKISQATMELYRQEKVNPLAGCLPLLIQIPVMIGLYWVMLESVELRQAPFIFWIHDLALPDPWHVLPVFMGITMLIQQQLNPAPPDPMQARVMMLLPLLFTGLFWNFPAGLVLYWSINNALTILQQWYITRKYDKK